MSIERIALDGGLDLVRSRQDAAPGSLRDCQNFEVANRRGYSKIEGIRSFSGGVVNNDVDQFVFSSFPILGASGNMTPSPYALAGESLDIFQPGDEMVWGGTIAPFPGSPGNGTYLNPTGRGHVSYSRGLAAPYRYTIVLTRLSGKAPAAGDWIVGAEEEGDFFSSYPEGFYNNRVFMIVTDRMVTVKEAIAAYPQAFPSVDTDTIADAAALAQNIELSLPSLSDRIHAAQVPSAPSGIAGGFVFNGETYVIADIEERRFTTGAKLPATDSELRLYSSGVHPTGAYEPYSVESVLVESGAWEATPGAGGTAAGLATLARMPRSNAGQTVLTGHSVVTPTDNYNVTGASKPFTATSYGPSDKAVLWKEGVEGWERQDLGHEIRFNGGTAFPKVVNRAKRSEQLEQTVTTSAWTFPTSATGWSNSDNVKIDDGTGATIIFGSPHPSGPLVCSNFGFALSPDDIVLGIEVEVKRKGPAGALFTVVDSTIELGGITSQNKALTGNWPTTYTTVSYGGATDTWGAALSPEIVNSDGFGVRIDVRSIGGGGGVIPTDIDYVRVRLTYRKRTSLVYFWNGTTDVATGRVIWYHKEKGDWSTSDAEGTLTVYDISNPSAIGTGVQIRTLPSGSGSLNGVCRSKPDRVYLPSSKQLAINESKYVFTESNFYASDNSDQVFGVSGAGHAFSWDGNYLIQIRTGVEPIDDKPRHVAKHLDQLLLGYVTGSVMASDLGYPESFAGVVGGTLGGSSPISDDTTYLFAGGAQEISTGDAVHGMTPLSAQSTGVFCRNSIQQIAGYGGSLVSNLISGQSGILEYTLKDIGIPVFLDYRGVGHISATQAFGDFARGRLSDNVSPWLLPKLQQGGAVFNGVASVEIIRNKNEYRVYFKDKDVLTLTMVGNEFGNPQFTKQKLPFVPRVTFSGKTLVGKDIAFIAPSAVAVTGDDNELSTTYKAIPALYPNANSYPPTFLYQLDVGTTWDALLPIEAFIELNGTLTGADWADKKFDRMVLGGLCYGYSPLTVSYAVNFDDIETTRSHVSVGSISAEPIKAFSEQQFSTTTPIDRGGYALAVRFDANGLPKGEEATAYSPYYFRPVTLQSMTVFFGKHAPRR